MKANNIVNPQVTFYRGLIVTAVGLVHFVRPQWFDSINRMGFPANPRRFVYINGAIETTMGLLTLHPRTRLLSRVVSVLYMIHLVGNILRVRFLADR